eukprot:TRINITY_DN1054_c0_g1_i1.p1 TRINITY_DN1054_c0_g1~~TRINITY_DN1054_c0_g1_i1.p1  ORF type:complete len:943 (+),score=257.10 TRINITY_DN1054_c0_g1_i1:29-2830(+)
MDNIFDTFQKDSVEYTALVNETNEVIVTQKIEDTVTELAKFNNFKENIVCVALHRTVQNIIAIGLESGSVFVCNYKAQKILIPNIQSLPSGSKLSDLQWSPTSGVLFFVLSSSEKPVLRSFNLRSHQKFEKEFLLPSNGRSFEFLPNSWFDNTSSEVIVISCENGLGFVHINKGISHLLGFYEISFDSFKFHETPGMFYLYQENGMRTIYFDRLDPNPEVKEIDPSEYADLTSFKLPWVKKRLSSYAKLICSPTGTAVTLFDNEIKACKLDPNVVNDVDISALELALSDKANSNREVVFESLEPKRGTPEFVLQQLYKSRNIKDQNDVILKVLNIVKKDESEISQEVSQETAGLGDEAFFSTLNDIVPENTQQELDDANFFETIENTTVDATKSFTDKIRHHFSLNECKEALFELVEAGNLAEALIIAQFDRELLNEVTSKALAYLPNEVRFYSSLLKKELKDDELFEYIQQNENSNWKESVASILNHVSSSKIELRKACFKELIDKCVDVEDNVAIKIALVAKDFNNIFELWGKHIYQNLPLHVSMNFLLLLADYCGEKIDIGNYAPHGLKNTIKKLIAMGDVILAKLLATTFKVTGFESFFTTEPTLTLHSSTSKKSARQVNRPSANLNNYSAQPKAQHATQPIVSKLDVKEVKSDIKPASSSFSLPPEPENARKAIKPTNQYNRMPDNRFVSNPVSANPIFGVTQPQPLTTQTTFQAPADLKKFTPPETTVTQSIPQPVNISHVSSMGNVTQPQVQHGQASMGTMGYGQEPVNQAGYGYSTAAMMTTPTTPQFQAPISNMNMISPNYPGVSQPEEADFDDLVEEVAQVKDKIGALNVPGNIVPIKNSLCVLLERLIENPNKHLSNFHKVPIEICLNELVNGEHNSDTITSVDELLEAIIQGNKVRVSTVSKNLRSHPNLSKLKSLQHMTK